MEIHKHIQLFHDWFHHLLFNILLINWNSVAVIIPVYNRETLIARAINSCIDQTLNKSLFEIIVINDGSTDSTDLILSSFLRDKANNIRTLNVTNSGRVLTLRVFFVVFVVLFS